MTAEFFDPGIELSYALEAGGLGGQVPFSVNTRLRSEPRVQSRVLDKARLSAAQFRSLIEGLRFREAGVFIDDLAVTVTPGDEATWKLEILHVSTPDGRGPVAPRLFDGDSVVAWASVVAAAVTQDSSDALMRWKRNAGLTGRLEIVTESKKAAASINSELSKLRGFESTAKLGVFDEHKRWKVVATDLDLSDRRVALSTDEVGDGAAHSIKVGMWARGLEERSLSADVSRPDQVRVLIEKIRVQMAERTALGVALSIEVDDHFPLSWLELAVFDLYDIARWVPTDLDIDLEANVVAVLSVKGSLDRCPIRPLHTIGTGQSGRREVLAGIQVLSDSAAKDPTWAALGPARRPIGTGSSNHVGENFVASSDSRPTDSRQSGAALAKGPTGATAGALGVALQKLRHPEIEAKPPRWRPFLDRAWVEEVRASEVVINTHGKVLEKGTRAVIGRGHDYVGSVEIVKSAGDTKHLCKITDWVDGPPRYDTGRYAVIIDP